MEALKLDVKTFRTIGELKEAIKDIPDNFGLEAHWQKWNNHELEENIPYEVKNLQVDENHQFCFLDLTKAYADYDKNKN